MSGRRSSKRRGQHLRHDGHGRELAAARDLERRRRRAEQNGDGMLELRALRGRLDRLRLRARQLGLREQHVGSRRRCRLRNGPAPGRTSAGSPARCARAAPAESRPCASGSRSAPGWPGRTASPRQGRRRSPGTRPAPRCSACDSLPHRSTSQLATTPAERLFDGFCVFCAPAGVDCVLPLRVATTAVDSVGHSAARLAT